MAGFTLPKTLMPHPRTPRRRVRSYTLHSIAAFVIVVTVVGTAFLSFPSFLASELTQTNALLPLTTFPVTVDPKHKRIVQNPAVDALFTNNAAALTASAYNARGVLAWLANLITSLPGYQLLAAVGAADTKFVTIYPGYREEQVAHAFGTQLGWNARTERKLLVQVHTTAPTLLEGQFVPGTYTVPANATLTDVQSTLGARFDTDILSRYSTTTSAAVPLEQALTIASLLERETRDPTEMRMISGIVWNRLWSGMNLQIDATLQYAKSSASASGSWWPRVVPKDKYIKSAYNTYQHAGLPPGPIANPSLAAVLAALNPIQTDCLFYFHDKNSVFHCAKTYEEHVALLKKYYGQGK